MSSEYQYDVAFSFCDEDEHIATTINDLLSDRYSTFIYINEQKKLVTKDGMEEFSKVFAFEARIVIVIYREKYGKKGFTMVEENAIKNRVMKEGLDFLMIIPVGKDKKGPVYYPPTRLWHNYDIYGAEGAMLVIEHKIAELGGEQKAISAIDKAKRIKRNEDYQKRLEKYKSISNADYWTDGWKEFECLREITKLKFEEAIQHMEHVKSFLDQNDSYLIYQYKNLQIDITWLKGLKHLTEEPITKVNLVKLSSNDTFNMRIDRSIIKSFEYVFAKNMSWENVWQEKSKSGFNTYKSDALAEIIVNHFMDFIENPGKFQKGDSSFIQWG